jgi:YHS domain-containing protein
LIFIAIQSILARGSVYNRENLMAKDPVCGMEIDSEEMRFFTDYNDGMYYFCSAECKRSFDDHPDTYIQEKAKQEHGL